MYLGNKDTSCIFKICCTISIFLQSAVYFIILSFLVHVIFTFYIKDAPKLNVHPWLLKMKLNIECLLQLAVFVYENGFVFTALVTFNIGTI
jgi:hypothetical protein